ncbi:MAG: FliA/WhiG family RNA polymerase sigma factor [Spirochaetia bacterium]|nr:FliA/WhiG family RNA polymerase sigma factor [Spirochaetota bacterium]MCX8096631.1 FliA/WhiG family RNA polymerase sigma factor [Spirochaetota bacterium]MDW8112078.1 FliA/WhiG family RNA polymerase sigma factor [Spirochaetia bacterium]
MRGPNIDLSKYELDPEEEDKKWKEYKKTGDIKIRNFFIEKYSPLVKYVVSNMNITVNDQSDYDDLIGWGIDGLIDAIERFDPDRGVKFKTYAIIRIRGAIYDKLREMDWIPRSVRQIEKEYHRAVSELQYELGEKPSEDMIAEKLGVSPEEFEETSLKLQSSRNYINSLDDMLFSDSSSDSTLTLEDMIEAPEETTNPETIVIRNEIIEKIKEAIKELPEKELQVIMLYYHEELTLKEIGAVLNVTESRVSQLHARALELLKEKLKPFLKSKERK